MVPLIAVTSYGRREKTVVNPPDDAHYCVAASYVDAVRRAGGAAVVLPGAEPHFGRWLDAFDAVVFSGGSDLPPALYGGDDAHRALGCGYRGVPRDDGLVGASPGDQSAGARPACRRMRRGRADRGGRIEGPSVPPRRAMAPPRRT